MRNGSVIDLQITPGEVRAQVMGSSLYSVTASVTAVPEKQWQTICADCSGSIDSLVELLQGRLSNGVMERICKPGSGLFPSPKEISFECSCPDWASMCKHVAAVLYGVGARLDQQPEVLFTLRRVDAKDLVSQASKGLPTASKRPASGKVLDDALLADVFGLEMAEVSPPVKPAKAKAAAKTTAARKAASGKAPVKPAASPRKSTTAKAASPKTKAAASAPAPKAKTVATKQVRVQPAKDKALK